MQTTKAWRRSSRRAGEAKKSKIDEDAKKIERRERKQNGQDISAPHGGNCFRACTFAAFAIPAFVLRENNPSHAPYIGTEKKDE